MCRECSRAPLLPRHPARHAALTSCTVRGTRTCSSARPDPGGGRCDDASNTPFWERLFLQLYVLCVCAPSFPEFFVHAFFFRPCNYMLYMQLRPHALMQSASLQRCISPHLGDLKRSTSRKRTTHRSHANSNLPELERISQPQRGRAKLFPFLRGLRIQEHRYALN